MITAQDCIPCLTQMAENTIKRITRDKNTINIVLEKTAVLLKEMNRNHPPPKMGQQIHRLICKATGISDPFAEIKDHCTRTALALYPELKKIVRDADDRFSAAARLAIAGNIIDFAVPSGFTADRINAAVAESRAARIDQSALDRLKAQVTAAEHILYIADNAGETVFDRIFIETLPYEKICYCVRGGPVLNDTIQADAETAGLSTLVKVIDSGTDLPGIIPAECSNTFNRYFDRADLVIAKGQGNYETLDECSRNIFFLFRVKCPAVAKLSGLPVGSTAVVQNRPPVAP